MILLLVPVHVPTGEREEIVDDEARCRLELEGGAQLSVDRLTTIQGRELLVGQVDDAHLLVVGKGLVDPDDERLPESTAEENVGEPAPFDRGGATTGAEIDEVVWGFDLASRQA